MSQDLRDLLHRGADQTRVVSYEAGVLREGHKKRRNRRFATTGAAAVLALGMAGGFVLLGSVAADPNKTDDNKDADTAEESTAWQQIPETLYFTTGYDGIPGAVSATGEEVESVELAFEPDYWGEFTISPTGQWWSKVGDAGLYIGELVHDGELSGDQPASVSMEDRKVCGPHMWSPDGTQLIVGSCETDEGALLIIDAASGDIVTTIEAPEGMDAEIMSTPFASAVWTADGEHLVWGNNDDGFTMALPDGTERVPFELSIPQDQEMFDPDNEEPTLPVVYSLSAVSSDGRYVSMEWTFTEDGKLPEYTRPPDGTNDPVDPQGPGPFSTNGAGCSYVLDTTTAAAAELPIPEDAQCMGLVFGPSGQMMVMYWPQPEDDEDFPANEVGLFSADGQELDRRVIPEAQFGFYSYL